MKISRLRSQALLPLNNDALSCVRYVAKSGTSRQRQPSGTQQHEGTEREGVPQERSTASELRSLSQSLFGRQVRQSPEIFVLKPMLVSRFFQHLLGKAHPRCR